MLQPLQRQPPCQVLPWLAAPQLRACELQNGAVGATARAERTACSPLEHLPKGRVGALMSADRSGVPRCQFSTHREGAAATADTAAAVDGSDTQC
jgi:hypothetical protein